MQTPPNLDNQQAWGGQCYDNQEVTLVGPERREPHLRPLLQPAFIASSSDDVFHPVPGDHVPTVYTLPDVPPFIHQNPPRNRAYSPMMNTFPGRLNYPSTFTSYNNPGFIPPPLHPPLQQPQHTEVYSMLGALPPI